MKLTTLQVNALEYLFKRQMNMSKTVERHQKRVLKNLINKGLLTNIHTLTDKGLEVLKQYKPQLFETSNLVGKDVFEQINWPNPIDLIVQRHIDNLINTYGQDQVMSYIELRKAG